MLSQFRPAFILIISFAVITGLIYPLAITGIAQIVMPSEANGSLVLRDGTVIGSALIGQNFTSEKYFWSRPSLTTGTDVNGKTIDQPYNAANSMSSNLGPTSAKLIETIHARAKVLSNGQVPGDLITASASGLDPHISPESALFQVKRVAAARHLNEQEISDLVQKYIEDRFAGIFGEPHVNVLALNLALDKLSSKQ